MNKKSPLVFVSPLVFPCHTQHVVEAPEVDARLFTLALGACRAASCWEQVESDAKGFG